jgi:quinolinate synthase
MPASRRYNSSFSVTTSSRGIINGNNSNYKLSNNNVRTLSTSASAAPPSLSQYTSPLSQQTSSFPSLIIGPNRSLTPIGSFATAQAAFLDPPTDVVNDLLDKLIELNIGIVAHYYMDVELQGVLHAVKRRQLELVAKQKQQQQQQQQQQNNNNNGEETAEMIIIPDYPLVAIADSLKMGDDAVNMCVNNNASAIICLGVDFMSESVSAIMTRNGYGHVPVYRATPDRIGCSLAESAEADGYRSWLVKCATDSYVQQQKCLHVVYINTSLETKAISSSIIPTITCTSSNVLQTILQSSYQFGPASLKVCYGPDTYMGLNLVSLLDAVLTSNWSNERIQTELHPHHNRLSIQQLKNNIVVYPNGNCVVHHMFGQSVVDTVERVYSDAYVTAHLEVPGEMFQIALRKSLVDEGVVGSTSNILNFIERKVEEAAAAAASTTSSGGGGEEKVIKRLKFILGTEAGMVTSIVRSVQDILEMKACQSVEAEIIFPVSANAVMEGDETLGMVPGSAGGEGCSTAGGCATCPFMKMNDLDAVQDIVDMIDRQQHEQRSMNVVVSSTRDELQLAKHLPPNRLVGKSFNGRDAIDLGTEPIMYMRGFMKDKRLCDELVEKVERMGLS